MKQVKNGAPGQHQSPGASGPSIEVTDAGGVLVARPGGESFDRALVNELSQLSSGCSAIVICLPRRTFVAPQADRAPLLDALLQCEVPVIAALADGADAATWLVALACDDVVYAETGCYAVDDVACGWAPSGGATYLFPARLGAYFGQEALLASDSYTGRELYERGAASQVVPAAAVTLTAVDQARAMAAALRAERREARMAERRDILEDVREARRAERESVAGVPVGRERLDLALAGTKGAHAVDLELVDGCIAIVTLHDREHKNTFSDALMAGLTEAFARIGKNPTVKAVVLTGYDSYFACGGTKEALLAIQGGAAKFTDHPVTALPATCDVPVVAAMQGHGLGAGWALGMFCDVILMSAESTYVSPYMRYGFTPGAGATLIFPRRLGALGTEILFTATEYKGLDLKARRAGMRVLARADVKAEALRLARRIASAPREVVVHLKGLFNRSMQTAIGTAFQQESAMHERTFVGSPEVLSRIEAAFSTGDPSAATARAAVTPDVGAVSDALAELLAHELGVGVEDVDRDRLFVDLGLDSVTGITWLRQVNRRYGLKIAAAKVYDHPTVTRFARHVVGELAGRPAAAPPRALQTAAPREAQARPPVAPAPSARPRAVAPVDGPAPMPGIAVIGMAGRFPKARHLDEFWENIANGRDCICEVPASRWSLERHYDPDPRALGKTYSKWMGVLDDVDAFDAAFFNISPLEAKWTDPQQRLFLESCWHCIESAGYRASQLSGSACGVFVGCAASDYGAGVAVEGLTGQAIIGNSCSILASRISYILDLHGPSMAIDTACSSSLVALASACDALALGNVDLALAGGVSVMTTPAMHVMTSKAGMLSPSGRCRTFDQGADGFVPGEGVGVVLLKRLEDALRDGDSIHGVLRGWGVNQDGKTNGITAPSAEAQRRLESSVYRRFAVDVAGIQLVEAHGTGTKLGDPIEVEALTASFREFTDNAGYCALGSVKSNIGHLMPAAGIAGLVKVLLALRHRKLPPTVHHHQLNEHIQIEGGPFYVNTTCSPWEAPAGQPRRAAVSSFGFSGTNAHVVVEDWDPGTPRPDQGEVGPELFLLSARDEDRLRAAAGALRDMLARDEQTSSGQLADIAHTLRVGREPWDERLAVVASSAPELGDRLRRYLDGEASPHVFRGRASQRKDLEASTDDDFAACVEQWLRKRKWTQLAKAWVDGADIDWTSLNDGIRRRVLLPGYPFARTSYWLPAVATSGAPASATAPKVASGPATTTLAKPTGIVLASCDEAAPLSGDVQIEEHPGVAVVTGAPSVEELAGRIAAVAHRESTKVIMVDLSGADPGSSQWPASVRAAERLLSVELPVVGILRAGGNPGRLLLASGCDLLLVADDVALGGPCVSQDLGNILSARFGAAAAGWLLGCPDGLDGARLRSMGVRVVPAAALDVEATKVASELAELPRVSLSELSRLLKSEVARGVRHMMDATAAPTPPATMPAASAAGEDRLTRVTVDAVELTAGADGVAIVEALAGASPARARRAIAAAIGLALQKGAKALVISDEHETFFSAPSLVDEEAEALVELSSVLARCPLPTIAAASATAGDAGWALALACDVAVHGAESEYRYDRRGQLVSGRIQALFQGRLGRYLGAEVLLTGEGYKGSDLQARGAALAAPRASVRSVALQTARAWALLDAEQVRHRRAGLSALVTAAIDEAPLEERNDAPPSRTDPVSSSSITPRPAPPTSEFVAVETSDDQVVVVTMRDRASKNGFTEGLARGLAAAFEYVASSEARAVVLTGYDQYFSSGGTKEALTEIQRGNLKYSDVPLYDVALKCQVPVVAAVQGHALGAGWALALFADVIILSAESVYSSTFMRYGFTPGAGSTLLFPRQLGVELGREALLTAARYAGRDLAGRGVAMRVLPRAQVRDAAIRVARRLASESPAVLRALKTRLGADLRAQIDGTYARELAMQEKTFVGSSDVLRRIEEQFEPGFASQPAEPARSGVRDHGLPPNGPGDRAAESAIRDFLCESFARELHMEPRDVRPECRFFDMGLDSITGVTWIQAVNREYGVIITIKQLHEHPTIASLAAFLATRVPPRVESQGPSANDTAVRRGRSSGDLSIARPLHPSLVRLNDRRQGRPIFWIHAGVGGVDGYENLARRLQRPFFGVQARGWADDEEPLRGVQSMAANYLRIVRSVQPEGPYDVGGYSIGGMLAFELARQLQAARATVASLVMVDTLDTVGLGRVDLSHRGELLHVANILLGAAHGHDRDKLIHSSELSRDLDDTALREQLIALVRDRKLVKSEDAFRAMLTRMTRIQRAYDVDNFRIEPLERPLEVDGLYFRNQSGRFLGELGGYYNFGGDRLPVDGTCYWSEWERHIPRLRVIDVPASNHMTLLVEPAATEVIVQHCERHYQGDHSTQIADGGTVPPAKCLG